MASPSPKRRKTDGGSSRASYHSPTKASLARFNPSLLSLSSSSPRRSSQRRASNVLDYVLGRSDLLPEAVEQDTRRSAGGTTGSTTNLDEQSGSDDDQESMDEPEANRNITHDRKDREVTDDLPETPQHENERPEYHDTPPRGILFSTPRRRKRALQALPADEPDEGEASIETLTVNVGELGTTAMSADAEPEERYRPPTAEERAVLKAKTAELNALRKEARTLQQEVESFERHFELQQGTAIDDTYPDVNGLL